MVKVYGFQTVSLQTQKRRFRKDPLDLLKNPRKNKKIPKRSLSKVQNSQ